MYDFLLVFSSNFVTKTHCFWDIRLQKMLWPWKQGYYTVTFKPGLRVKVIGTDMDRFATYNFLLTFHSNHGPILYHFRDIWRFQSKLQKKFPPPSILHPCRRGSPWNWVPAVAVRKLEWWGYRPTKKSDDIFSHLDRMHEHDRQTDGRTPGHNKDRAYA